MVSLLCIEKNIHRVFARYLEKYPAMRGVAVYRTIHRRMRRGGVVSLACVCMCVILFFAFGAKIKFGSNNLLTYCVRHIFFDVIYLYMLRCQMRSRWWCTRKIRVQRTRLILFAFLFYYYNIYEYYLSIWQKKK